MLEEDDRFDALRAFLPRLVLERLARTGDAPACPSSDRLEGVLLWTDVTGFTPLVERLAGEGSGGAERLSEALGTHFGRLIEICEGEGGDLLFLAGDGSLSLFRPAAEERIEATTVRALAVARAVIRELDGSRPQPNIALRLRVALAAGPFSAFSVGGVGGAWLHLVGGKVIDEIAAAMSAAAPGEIALVGSARAFVTSAMTDKDVSFPPPAHRRAAPWSTPPPPLGTLDSKRVLTQVLSPIAARIIAGHSDFLAEFRAMTVAFVDLSAVGVTWELDHLQQAAVALQTTAADFEGTVYQLVQDDKGTIGVIAFGLPGCSHEDDPVRSVRFALRLSERLRPLIGNVSMGIATGPVFCGPCGAPHRSQYAIVGPPMNRASRLMSAAAGVTLLDETTYTNAIRSLEPSVARRVLSKSVGEPLRAHVATLAHGETAAHANLIGRGEERQILARRVDDLCERGDAAVVTLEGPPGIGKTSLLMELRTLSRARGCAFACGCADFVEIRTPFFALRPAMREFLGLASISSPAEVESRIGDTLRALGESVDLMPLLSQAIGERTADNALTRQMTPAVRAENRNRLLAALVAFGGRRQRTVVAIDDLHWCDAATCGLLPELAKIAGVLWVLACRNEGPAPELFGRLAERVTRMPLRGLDVAEIAAIAAATLETDALPDELIAPLVERAAGNPLYSRELALSLRETGRIYIVDGRCRLASSFGTKAASDLPSSLSALIKSRLDRLPQGAVVALRVASVVGQSFEHRLLAEVLRSISTTLEDELGVLEREGFLQTETMTSEPRFAFRHATIQAVAYELNPKRQLADLHRTAAKAIEKIHGTDSPPTYGHLAYHWSEAGDGEKTARYSALAARQALDSYANQDAVELYDRAIRSHRKCSGSRGVDVTLATLYSGVGRAHYSLTQPREARVAFESALRSAGFSDPGGGAGVLTGLARYFLAKLVRGSTVRAQAEGETRERCLAAIEILSEWTALDFWEGRPTEGAAKALMGHRLAQSVLSSSLAAEAVAQLGYVFALTAFRFRAEAELLRSVELALGSEDLQAIASSRVLLGMYYTLDGRAADAVRHLEEAQQPAERLGGGLWRHRARFALGETLLCLGRFSDARAAFAQAAALSIGAEPPVVGLAMCMSALAVARLGCYGDALALIDGPTGLPLIGGKFLPLQRFTSLGIKAEVLVRLGRADEATEVAREAWSLAERGQDCDVFFVGLHGYAGVLEAHLEQWLRMRPTTGDRAARRPAEFDDLAAAYVRLTRFARLYPAARPRAALFKGRLLIADGRPEAARPILRRALKSANRMGMPYERALAHLWLSEVENAVESAWHLDQSLQLCREFSMKHEATVTIERSRARGRRS
jgi:class 3 adenylate cyclase/tetratricopeptide (TPR) repeat protein